MFHSRRPHQKRLISRAKRNHERSCSIRISSSQHDWNEIPIMKRKTFSLTAEKIVFSFLLPANKLCFSWGWSGEFVMKVLLLIITNAEQQQESQPWRTPPILPNPIFVVDYVWLLSFILFIIAEKSVCALFVRWNRINILDTRYCKTLFFVFKLGALPM